MISRYAKNFNLIETQKTENQKQILDYPEEKINIMQMVYQISDTAFSPHDALVISG